MSIDVGGRRTRFISDSFYEMVRSSMEALGWFDDGRQHSSIEMVRVDPNWDEPTKLNTLALLDSDIVDDDLEMGSNYTEDRWTVYADFYGEDDSIGKHVAGDLRDILRGKMPSIGRSRPIVPVYDFSVTPDPPFLFNVEIENVVLDRSHNATKPWMKHWYSVRAELVDGYGDEDDA